MCQGTSDTAWIATSASGSTLSTTSPQIPAIHSASASDSFPNCRTRRRPYCLTTDTSSGTSSAASSVLYMALRKVTTTRDVSCAAEVTKRKPIKKKNLSIPFCNPYSFVQIHA